MNEGDKLEDFFLKFILEKNKELEAIVEVKFDGFWKIRQESNEVLLAQGTGDDGENNIDIYVNIGRREEAFARKIARKIQELITTAGEVEDNYILCIAKEFNNADIEELMQDVIFYRGKCIHLIFLTVDINEEGRSGNLKDITKQEAIKVYRKEH